MWHRLWVWRQLPSLASLCLAWVPSQQCQCRVSGKAHYGQVRRTSFGPMCLACWLEWPSCDMCGVGLKEPSYNGLHRATFRGKNYCADCLVPEVSENYVRWSLECMLSLGSSFAYVVDDIPPLTLRLTRGHG